MQSKLPSKLPRCAGPEAEAPTRLMVAQYHMAATYRRPERAKTMKEVALESQVAHGRKFGVRRHTHSFESAGNSQKSLLQIGEEGAERWIHGAGAHFRVTAILPSFEAV